MSKIPKTIHYCWVGGNPKPASVLYCIESWKKYCPDYEIIEWNETNYDFTKNEYMKQAYEAKKWGFVPDYARMDIIYQYGGIYLDTDVEMVKSFDPLLDNQCFFGFEETGDGEFFVNCGHGFGAIKKHPVIKLARDLYDHLSFIKEDGTLNLLASPYFTTKSLCEFGFIQENKDQILSGVQVYASDVLCPKNFRTGKIKRTSRTVSIHHFTASWVDEEIKKELYHQQKIKKCFGNFLGKYILIAESVIKKYGFTGLFSRLPVKVMKKIKRKLMAIKDNIPYYIGLMKASITSIGKDNVILLDTSLNSDNCGDAIIMENCIKQLEMYINTDNITHVPTHSFPTIEQTNALKNAKVKILCGTNIMSGDMQRYGLWKLTADIAPYKNTILMGVGFDSKSKEFTRYTKLLFKTILKKDVIHSVRDSFAEQKLRSMGISNVLYTGCPTMWGLTEEFCATIPINKADNVICTLTDYNQDPMCDKAMLDILLNSYEKVYLWLQGRQDLEYVKKLGYQDKVILVESTLEAYDIVLAQNNLDYVGTRLHAGIRALSKSHRSIIISIDNRAECIGSDTGLPTLKREDITTTLKDKLKLSFSTNITMPWENIEEFKQQFIKVNG